MMIETVEQLHIHSIGLGESFNYYKTKNRKLKQPSQVGFKLVRILF